HPVTDHREASVRMAYPKIVHPASQDRVDLLDHPPHRLADVPSEYLSQLCEQGCPLFQLRRVVRSPHPVTTEDAAILKAQKGETLSVRQVYHSTLIFIDLHSELRQFLSQSPFYRLYQPVMTRMSVNQDHQVICKTRILDLSVSSGARGLNRLLQHPIHLSEIDVTEHRRNHPALRDALLPSRLQDHLDQPHHCSIIDPPCHLFQQ